MFLHVEQDYSVKSPNNGLVKRLGSGSTRFKLSVKVFIFANISAPNLKFLFISSFYLLQIHIYSVNLNFVNTNCENRALREEEFWNFLTAPRDWKKITFRIVELNIYIFKKRCSNPIASCTASWFESVGEWDARVRACKRLSVAHAKVKVRSLMHDIDSIVPITWRRASIREAIMLQVFRIGGPLRSYNIWLIDRPSYVCYVYIRLVMRWHRLHEKATREFEIYGQTGDSRGLISDLKVDPSGSSGSNNKFIESDL